MRDGHEVWLVGRDIDKARAVCARIGGHALACDRQATPETIFAVAADVVIDAAGPFQGYGDDRYRLASSAIDNAADYLDLLDGADFTAGISALDAQACRERRKPANLRDPPCSKRRWKLPPQVQELHSVQDIEFLRCR